ncbi:MAG TPA: hypothetical protein VGH67_06310 [Solirubrobacteraceae bacterium]|jgi:hypothetical protein
MRELTMHELDAQLAVQLPTRELMGSSCGCKSYRQPSQSNSAAIGNANGNGNGNSNGFLNVLNGNLNGNANGDGNVVVEVNG